MADPLEIAEPFNAWYLWKEDGSSRIEKAEFSSKPQKGRLLLRTLPAYHSEAAMLEAGWDGDGLSGNKVSCFFLQTTDYGILFTGDTEYPEAWDKRVWSVLKDNVTVLVANMKTLEYLPQKGSERREGESPQWDALRLTRNQLGFEGTRRLAAKLMPKALVIRALGLECAIEEVKGTLRYAPDRLAVYRKAMQMLVLRKYYPTTQLRWFEDAG